MTGILEAPIHPPAEEGAAYEPADKSSAARTSRSKAKVKTKSAAKGSKSGTTAAKASRGRTTASDTATGRANGNGSVLAGQEVQKVEDLSATGPAATAERPAVEPPAIQSADDEELEPIPTLEDSQQETSTRRAPSWVAVRSWVGNNILLSVVAVALVVSVVFLTTTQLSLNSENSLNSARTSALAAANTYAVDLASYNYKHLDQDFGKVLAESTPTFKQNFTQSSEALKTALIRYKAWASANVVATGLVSATTSHAVVLVFLSQTVDNTLQKGKPTTESRVEITLLRSGGRWLIDQVRLL